MRRLLGLLCLLTLTTVLGVPAHATGPSPLDPRTLPRGPQPVTAYVVGRTLHLPSGRVVRISAPERDARWLRLVGHSSLGWLVLDTRAARVLAIRHGRTRATHVHPDWAYLTDLQLSPDGTRLLLDEADEGDDLTTAVVAMSGHVLRRHFWPTRRHSWTELGFDGDHVYVGSGHRVSRLDVATGGIESVSDAARGRLADPGHNLLFVRTDTGVGPTRLSRPGAPTWTASFEPEAVSPQAHSVVSEDYRSPETFTVRRVTDGSVTGQVTLPASSRTPTFLGWESERRILLQVVDRHEYALVACTTAGRCTRASGWRDVPFGTPANDW